MANTFEAPTKPKRLLSLDVLRGITIAFMIMVNNNGGPGSWGFMNHAPWTGLTATDLVFPTFVFVMGASIVFAFESRLARGATKAQLAVHTAQRAVILFALGWVVNNFPLFHWQGMRFCRELPFATSSSGSSISSISVSGPRWLRSLLRSSATTFWFVGFQFPAQACRGATSLSWISG